MLLSFPWLFLSFLSYNFIVLLQKPRQALDSLDQPLASLSLPSDSVYTLTVGNALMFATVILLFLEILKSTRRTRLPVLDHALAFVFLLLCIVEFALQPQAATSVFFLITIAALINLIAGLSLTRRSNS